MFDYEKHIEMLKENKRKGLSTTDLVKEMNKSLGHTGFIFNLSDYLNKSVNAQMSDKLKEKYRGNLRGYLQRRNQEESEIIFSTDWHYWFENEVSIEDLEFYIKNGSEKFVCALDSKTLMMVIIQSLKDYIDAEDTENPKCDLIKTIYLNLKKDLSSKIPFEQGDSFLDYLNAKPERELQENSRFTGERCIFCGSKNVTSYGTMWKCNDCKRTFRKHRA